MGIAITKAHSALLLSSLPKYLYDNKQNVCVVTSGYVSSPQVTRIIWIKSILILISQYLIKNNKSLVSVTNFIIFWHLLELELLCSVWLKLLCIIFKS